MPTAGHLDHGINDDMLVRPLPGMDGMIEPGREQDQLAGDRVDQHRAGERETAERRHAGKLARIVDFASPPGDGSALC